MNGTISKIVADRAFGFIKGENGVEYFFHRDDFHGFFQDLLTDYEKHVAVKVEFNPTQGRKGPRAEEVRLIAG